jgi:uncharacterized membrane protein SirB2
MSLHALCVWLAATPLSRLMQAHQWMVPAIQTLHILCIAIVLPAMALFCLRLALLAGPSRHLTETARRRLPWAWWALLALLASGILLIVAEPTRQLPNPAFQAKMAMLVLALALTAWCERSGSRSAQGNRLALGPVAVRIAGACALFLWVGIAVAGRWIAYMIES